MVRASHLTENRKVLVLEFARLSLQLRSIAVPQWIMEDSYQVQGQCQSPPQCLPGSLERARRDLETVFTQHFHELGRRHGLVVLLHLLFYSIQHFTGELKRPTTPYTYIVNCREFHE